MIFYGKNVANSLKEKIIAFGREQSPKLAIIQLIEDESLSIYLNSRLRIANQLGIEVECFNLSNASFEEIKNKIYELNNDNSIWGIMIDHPFPKHFNEQEIIDLIDPKKDVECLTSHNLKNIGKNLIAPPVASALIKVCEYYNVDLKNKEIAVIGDSLVVGKPIAKLLSLKGGKVETFNEQKVASKDNLKNKEIIISAVGKPRLIKNEILPEKSVLFDVGINVDEEGKICGDFEENCYENSLSYSPSPGGIGPVTTTMLFYNLFVLRGVIND